MYQNNMITNFQLLFRTMKLNKTILCHCDYVEGIRGSLNNFPDFFHMGTFIDSTHMKLLSPSK